MLFYRFWGAMSYILALYVAVMLVAWKIPRRSMFWLRVALCFACIVAYKYLFDYILSLLEYEEIVILVIRTLDSFVLYVLGAVSVAVCFKSNFWATLFCSTAGYCMQHMSQRTYLIIIYLVRGLDNAYINALLLSAVTAAFYVAIYFMFIKKSEYGGTMLDNKVQISVSFFDFKNLSVDIRSCINEKEVDVRCHFNGAYNVILNGACCVQRRRRYIRPLG